MNRTAVSKACCGDPWYEPNGRSATTNVLVTDRATARARGMSSSTVTGRDVSLPNTLLDAESPTSTTSMPASSKICAVYWSYAVSIAHFSPRAFSCCSVWVRIRLRGLGVPPYGAASSPGVPVASGMAETSTSRGSRVESPDVLSLPRTYAARASECVPRRVAKNQTCSRQAFVIGTRRSRPKLRREIFGPGGY